MPLPTLGPDACAFFAALSTHNDREWFLAERPRYEAAVVRPLKVLAVALGPRMLGIDPGFDAEPATGHALSRIHRDMRFARPGTGPYHEAAWLVFRDRGIGDRLPPAYFFEVAPDGFTFGMGFYSLPAWRMAQVREAIDRDPVGFGAATRDALAVPGLTLQGPVYARPRGGHLPEELRTWYERRWAHVEVRGTPAELAAPELPGRVAFAFERLAPLYRFWRDSGSARRPPDSGSKGTGGA